jgi:hypothetical protein
VFVSGWQQALTLLLAVIPGFIYQATRSQLRGPTPEEREIGFRVLRALAVSGFLALLYVGIMGSTLTDAVKRPGFPFKDDPQRTAWVVVALIFVVPIVGAFLVNVASTFEVSERITGRLHKILRIADKVSQYDPTPTAWDFASANMREGFVRVLTKDQTWQGGYLGENSYLTGYPEAREIFLQEAWLLGDDGSFIEAIKGTSGVWIRCDDAQLVQFLEKDVDSNYAERTLISLKLRKGRTLRVVVVTDT